MTEFLWGASTSGHQVEGNNVNSDWWQREQASQGRLEPSGDAVDSYHRYPEDMRLLADAGLNAYRFGIEWSRVEPEEGVISRAMLDHYRRMIDCALELGLAPVITLNHFTVPRWFAQEGGWLASSAIDRFRRYVRATTEILSDVPYVATINEPNMLAMMAGLEASVATAKRESSEPEGGIAALLAAAVPDRKFGDALISAHHAAREILKERTESEVGWTIANQSLTATPGNEKKFVEVKEVWEDQYLAAARDDDFVGVQAYTSRAVDADGIVPHPESPDNTITGWAYRPDAIGIAIRNTWDVAGRVPILITENGIATADDRRRIEYTREALEHVAATQAEGIDVRGYLHWSALDNYEWGHYEPTFGLIAVDRETFERRSKPSLRWLGEVARRGQL